MSRHIVQQLAVEVAAGAVAEHRVAEQAGGHRLQVAVVLLAHRLGRLLEHEELVLERRHRPRSPSPGRVRCTRRSSPRGQTASAWAAKLAEEEQAVVFEGQLAAGVGQDAHRRVGIAGVPAGVLHVVVELVLAVPAEHDVAEAEAPVERGEELVPRDVLAAQDAVDVEDADLDVRDPALFDDRPCVGRTAHLSRFHRNPRDERPVAPVVRRDRPLLLLHRSQQRTQLQQKKRPGVRTHAVRRSGELRPRRRRAALQKPASPRLERI